MARMRARKILPSEWVISKGLRGSAMTAASLSASPSRRSACPSNITPEPDVMLPPSKAAVIFLRPTAGNENGRRISSIMADVASMRWLKDRCKQLIHTLNQHLTLHPPAQNQALGE